MGLQQNLQDIQTNLLQAKTAIAQSISNKGVECSATDKLSTFASKIDSITTGSTGGTGEKFVVPNGLKFGYSSEFDPTLYDVSQLTNMRNMFYYCTGLTNLDLSTWNVDNVNYMDSMFYSCSALTSIDLSGWNTSKVIYMNWMFSNCSALTSIDLSNLDVSNVITLKQAFSSCKKLNELNLSGWNTSKVTDMSGMFYSCSALTSIDLSSFSLISCTNISEIFRFSYKLVNLQLPDLGHNETCNRLDLSDCSKLTKDSILYLFNNAFDRTAAGYSKAFTITLHSNTKALLSEDEIAIATNKGFTVV